ncbi:hypothetical protein N7492_000163 [Penicillium capsulatum]|uniref:Bacteriophage T5 Orf172 DNA-binding domain-containing protein n=1 Tax=Penicillium capsulatum TaxID=69766 RepID=A0A9W9IRB5_9EURO|nr:hypothetical protein N7492_000163 [Penicillium capsulatum]KAJ6130772.1 hypothetical protein N7512_003552 [Penicillium capsulatum]
MILRSGTRLRSYSESSNSTRTSLDEPSDEESQNSDDCLESYHQTTPKRPEISRSRDESFQSAESTSSSFGPRFELGTVDIPTKVTEVLEKKLGPTDNINGYVYVISHPNEPDMFKVGYSKSTRVRLASHKKCYAGFNIIVKKLMPHAHRMEKAIHAEFLNEHMEMNEICSQCNRSRHQEWLRVDKETLLESYWKWYRFAKTEPYTQEHTLRQRIDLPLPADSALRKGNPDKSSSSRKSTPKGGHKSARKSSSPSPPAPDSPLASRSIRADEPVGVVSSLLGKLGLS